MDQIEVTAEQLITHGHDQAARIHDLELQIMALVAQREHLKVQVAQLKAEVARFVDAPTLDTARRVWATTDERSEKKADEVSRS